MMEDKLLPKVIYIFGAGHSGSTLLDVLLSTHSEIQGVGEVHRLSLGPNSRKCGCGKTITTCNYWSPVIDLYLKKAKSTNAQVKNIFPPTTLARDRYSKSAVLPLDMLAVLGEINLISILGRSNCWIDRYLEIIKNSYLLYDAIAEVHAAKIVVDSTKNPLRGKMLYLGSPRRTFCLHLVRDGRAVAASMMRREQVPMHNAARSWRKACIKTEAALLSIPAARKQVIRYEDICRNPIGSVNGILSRFELSVTAANIDNMDNEHHQIPGNPAVHGGLRDIQIDEKWRVGLSRNDLKIFQSVAGWWNRRYGYID